MELSSQGSGPCRIFSSPRDRTRRHPHWQPSVGMLSLLLCGVSVALPLFVGAEECKDMAVQNETPSIGQPFAFNCTLPPVTFGEVNITWYKDFSKIPISKNIQLRVHQDQTWILFLPLTENDSGLYKCVIKDRDSCYRIQVNLTVFEKYWCDPTRRNPPHLSDEYKQILHVGNDSLTCHLHFPKSYIVDSVKWYKDCKEIKEKRFTPLRVMLLVNNVTAKDRGNYACQATLTHLGKRYMVLNSITVNVTKRIDNGGRIPKIIYPKNNSIEVQPGSTLIVDCNITDTWDNTNLRCWKVNNTLVDRYYRESKRIREGFDVF